MEHPESDERIARLLREGPAAIPFVELPGGLMTMGSHDRHDEEPIRLVRVRAFAVALTPVTNAEYACFLEATGHEPPGFWGDPRFTTPDCPVVGVSWLDAVDYCAWLSEVTGYACRLPTEAEREYAARGGVDGMRYHWGDEPWGRTCTPSGRLAATAHTPLGRRRRMATPPRRRYPSSAAARVSV